VHSAQKEPSAVYLIGVKGISGKSGMTGTAGSSGPRRPSFHPAVLRLIAMSARAAVRARKPIGMAGDMASNPLSIPFLLGVGLDSLSATAPRLLSVK
jgi:hypothetical protein